MQNIYRPQPGSSVEDRSQTVGSSWVYQFLPKLTLKENAKNIMANQGTMKKMDRALQVAFSLTCKFEDL